MSGVQKKRASKKKRKNYTLKNQFNISSFDPSRNEPPAPLFQPNPESDITIENIPNWDFEFNKKTSSSSESSDDSKPFRFYEGFQNETNENEVEEEIEASEASKFVRYPIQDPSSDSSELKEEESEDELEESEEIESDDEQAYLPMKKFPRMTAGDEHEFCSTSCFEDGSGIEGDVDSPNVMRNNSDFCFFDLSQAKLAVVVMQTGSEMAFYGKAMIRVLCGSASVMAYRLNDDTAPDGQGGQTVPIFGPETSPHPVIKHEAFHVHQTGFLKRLRTKLMALTRLAAARDDVRDVNGMTRTERCLEDILKTVQHTSTVVLLKPIDAKDDFQVETINRAFIIPKQQRTLTPVVSKAFFHSLGFGVCPMDNVYCLNTHSYQTVMDKMAQIVAINTNNNNDDDSKFVIGDSPIPRILVCGSQNRGKSTLLRLLVNSLLGTRWDEVLYLDTDPGQPEFTPPGCVSLTNVQNPLLGPPFSHQKAALTSCYIGGKSPQQSPSLYANCIRHILHGQPENENQLRTAPLLINTMGWTKGVGLSLLVDIVRLTKPTWVIQFTEAGTPLIDPAFMESACGWATDRSVTQSSSSTSAFNYDMDLIHIKCNRQFGGKIRTQPLKNRLWSMYRYMDELRKLKGILHEPIPLNSVVPYAVPFDSVVLHSFRAKLSVENALLALNCSWVALCRVDMARDALEDPEQPQMPMTLLHEDVNICLGFGIVRAIDHLHHLIYVITPLPLSTLQNVNALFTGYDDLPVELFKKQDVKGAIPYLSRKVEIEELSFLDMLVKTSPKSMKKVTFGKNSSF